MSAVVDFESARPVFSFPRPHVQTPWVPATLRLGGHARCRVMGVPLGHGAGVPGAELGPAALRIAGVGGGAAVPFRDVGDLPVSFLKARTPALARLERARSVAATCTRLEAAVRGAIAEGEVPVVLGGDHALAAGSVSGAAQAVRQAGGRLGVVWIDAHGDANTPETSPSGNLHGMPLAALLGAFDAPFDHLVGRPATLNPEDVVMVGVRDLDPGERAFLDGAGVARVGPRTGRALAGATLGALRHCTHIYVSFDVDGLDPDAAPGTGTPAQGGLTPESLAGLFAALRRDGRVCGLEVVEVNPVLDVRNRTARTAAAVLEPLLGD
ncbi:arginase [Myxococcota bacterium]|nr:arginase [Myxococcota bacterium]